ncbi:MAG: hypothetical protein R3C30_03415 [Hyphomonadaceae bacterium]
MFAAPLMVGSAAAGTEGRPVFWNHHFRGDQLDDIIRAWDAVRREFDLTQGLRGVLVSYAGSPLATIAFTLPPEIEEIEGVQRVGRPRHFIVNVEGDRIYVFPEGQGDLVVPN